MFNLGQAKTKVLVAIHGWSGIVLGFLLYAVVLTGTVAVVAHEIGHWSIGMGEAPSVSRHPVDANVRKAIDSINPKYRDDVSVFTSPRGHLMVWEHTQAKRPSGELADIGVLLELDAQTGQEIARREGWSNEVFRSAETALEQFLVDVHVRLHLPNPWGLLLTGILGLAMMVAAVSGLLMHPNLIKDSFTLRRHKKTLVAARDEHSVAGTWGLPFAFLLALTGAFFSFALSFGLPMMSVVAFGGDQAKMLETLVGARAAADARPAKVADLDTMIRDAQARAGGSVNRVSVIRYGRNDGEVMIELDPAPGALEPATLVYEASDGAFLRTKARIGTVPSLGSTLFSIIGPLHFGNFGGVISKLVWFALGFASSFMIATGMSLWLRRRAEDSRWRMFARVKAIVIFGLPVALAASAYGFLLSYPAQTALTATPLAFVIGAILVICYAMLIIQRGGGQALDAHLMFGLGLALIGLPIVRIATDGIFWTSALATGAYETVVIDLALLLGGALCIRCARRWGVSTASILPDVQPADRLRQPKMESAK
jgi:uncharacterized iron-regulated membrane protein